MVETIYKNILDVFPNLTAATTAYANVYNLKWGNSLAMQRVYQINERYNIRPTMIDPSPGGSVIYRNVKGQFGTYDRIEIRDAAVYHTNPHDHVDFMYITIHYRLNASFVPGVLSVLPNVSYNQITGELTASGFNMAEIINSLYIARYINEDRVSPENARYLYRNHVEKSINEYIIIDTNPHAPTPFTDILERHIFDKNGLFSPPIN